MSSSCASQPASKSAEPEAPEAAAPSSSAGHDTGSQDALKKDKASAEEDAFYETEGAPAQEADEAQPEALDGKQPFAEKRRERSSLVDELEGLTTEFNGTLEAESLSCDGAKPHQEAICSIAKRICSLKDDSHSGVQDCVQAKKVCASAKDRLKKECG